MVALTDGNNVRDVDDTYLLTRDTKERERLNAQHRIMLPNVGYVIHPSISKTLPKDSRVADIAAGSGAWTLGAAELLPPTARVDGYDISSQQFPEEYPSNVTFSVHNAKRPFPQELHGKYDLVHVRALVAAMDEDDWKLVLSNMVALLKPGGTLQWTEGDISRLRALRNHAAVAPFKAIPRLLNSFHGVASKRTGYGVEELPELFEDAGLRSVEADVYSSDRIPDTRLEFSRQYAVAVFGWARDSLGLSSEELKKWEQDIEKELQAGAYIRGDVVTVVGVNPK